MSSSNESEQENFTYFTPDFSEIHKRFLMGTNDKNDEIENNLDKRTNEIEKNKKTNFIEDSNENPFNQINRSFIEQNIFSIRDCKIDKSSFVNFTEKKYRKWLWDLRKYEKSEFKRRIESCIKNTIIVTTAFILLSFESIQRLVVDQTIIIVYLISIIQSDLTDTIIDTFLTLFGNGISLIFPYLAYFLIPMNKITVLVMIFFSTMFVNLLIGNLKEAGAWFSVQNIYYFFIFLQSKQKNDSSVFYNPVRIYLEFVIISLYCILVLFLFYSNSRTIFIDIKLRESFENALSSFKLLLISLKDNNPGKITVALTHSDVKIRLLTKCRDQIHQKIHRFWLENIFSINKYEETKIILRLLNRAIDILTGIKFLVEELLKNNGIGITSDMVFVLNNFSKAFDNYSFDTVKCFLNEKREKNFELKVQMKKELDNLWYSFINKKYKSVLNTKKTKTENEELLFLDFLLFSITIFFYLFTIIDQINSKRRRQKNNFKIIFTLFNNYLHRKINYVNLKNVFLNWKPYFYVFKNNLALFICTGIAFYTNIYPNTTYLIFPVGFCWSNSLGGTYNKNLQRLAGTLFGSFYGLFALKYIGGNRYIIAGTLSASVFFNTFIKENKKHSYFSLVSSFTTCWILLIGLDNSQDEVFRRIELTFLGLLISMIVLTLTFPKRAVIIIKDYLIDNLMQMEKVLLIEKNIFNEKDKIVDQNINEIEGTIIQNLIKNKFFQYSGSNWGPISLFEFTNNEMLSKLNEILDQLENNYQIISNLKKEVENEPNLFFAKYSMFLLDKIICSFKSFSNILLISANTLNDKDINELMQFDSLLVDWNLIIEYIINSIKTFKKCLKNKEKVTDTAFQADFDNLNQYFEKLKKNQSIYCETVNNLLKDIIEDEENEDLLIISFGKYRYLWGLNPFIYSIIQTIKNVKELQQLLIFANENNWNFDQ